MPDWALVYNYICTCEWVGFWLYHHYSSPWKGKLVYLLSSGGVVTTAPTVIQSTTPIKQKMAATTITIICHNFILSKKSINTVIKLHVKIECWYMYRECI